MTLAVDAITFDCYGTLIDWDRGLRQYLTRLLIAKRVSVPADELHKTWEAMQFIRLSRPYRRYRVILAESLEDALRRFKVTYDPEDGQRLAHAMGSWRPFKDVPEGLARLKRKFKLGIVSNTDRDIMSRTLTYFGTEMDVVVIAEDVKAYKPSPKGFEEALKRLSLPPERVLHAAFGVAYDLGAAKNLGMKLALVRRGQVDHLSAPLDLEVASITELADKLGA
ncbi:MAG TPA: haloacid dehalogenase type II [Planctomycetota bacterium]|nr:haloacid dehalogenase type II [Planctomycetota bacterium]